MEFQQLNLYVKDNGRFRYTMNEKDSGTNAFFGLFIGSLVKEEPCSLLDLIRWGGYECPSSEFPDVMTDEEIEELRDSMRRSLEE